MKNNYTPPVITTSSILINIEEIARDSDGAIRHALNAQLEVLKVLEDPTLLVPTVDIVLQHLLHGIEVANTEEECRLLKKDSSLLIQSLLYVSQVILLSNDKCNKELMRKMFVQATESAFNFAVVAAPIMFSKIKTAQKVGELINKIKILKNQNTSSSPSFLEKLSSLIWNLFNAKKNKEKYYIALDLIYDKLMRYKELLGTSILLSESVRNNAKQLIEFQIKKDRKIFNDLKDEYEDIEVNQPVLIFSTVTLGIAILIHLVLEGIDLFTENNHSYWYVYSIPVLTGLATYFYYSGIKKKAFDELSNAEALLAEKEATLEKKYDLIADALAPSL